MPPRKKTRRRPFREWVGGIMQTPFFIEDRDPPYRVEAVFWLELPEGAIVGTSMVPPDETAGSVGEALAAAFARPMVGSPRRPDRIRVANASLAAEVRAVVEDSIPVEIAPTPELREVMDAMVESMDASRPDDPARDTYLGRGKVQPATVAEMFRAAETLYRVAPWRVATDDQVIRLDIPALEVEGACLSIIGNLGESLGLLVFATLEDYEAFGEAGPFLRDPHSMQDLGCGLLALNFERGADLPDALRREVTTHGWPVAAPDAYPDVARYERDLVKVPASERDLEIVVAAARSVSTFFTKHRKLFALESDDPVCESFVDPDGREVRLSAPYEAYPQFEITTLPPTEVRHRGPKPGRNDPCHCGSGRKYKRCHMREDEAKQAPPPPAATAREVENRLIDKLVKYAGDRFGPAWLQHLEAFDDFEQTMDLAMPWTLHDVEFEGATLLDWYVREHGRRLSAVERAFIAAQQAAWLSVWEVTAVEPGASLTFTDLLSGDTRVVRERTASQSLVLRDAVLARIVDRDDASYLCGLYPRPLQPEDAAEVVRLARGRLRRKRAVPVDRLRGAKFGGYLIRKWEEQVLESDLRRSIPPRLSNSDGDPFLLTTDRFRLAPDAKPEVVTRLGKLDGVIPPDPDDHDFTFTTPGNAYHHDHTNTIVGHGWIEDGILRLDTNSVRRADTLRKAVEAVCGALIEHQIREHSDPQSPEFAASLGDADPREIPPEMQEIERQFMQRHYATWPDHPLPALGGRTPREAARTADGRRELDVLLKSMENQETRLRGTDGFDFSGLRRELGLD